VKLTIIPRSKGALGYAQYLPRSSYIRTRNDLVDQIAIMLGGITSEELQFGDISSGGSDDLQKVYGVARRMVADYGMGKETYNVTVSDEGYVRRESQFLAKKMDQEMMAIVEEAKQRCKDILTEKKGIIEQLAEALLQKETINSEDIRSIMGERPKFN
jgi:ATP-dependent Zn protease